ncbi:MAG: hypothetical protein GYA48_00720 [Chloroflexi bacterium]|nr:hypothetical protein [Chloroflexota bacterium]
MQRRKIIPPILLFLVSVISFGLFIPKLGFYMDDWRVLAAARTQGVAGLQQFLAYDGRPYAVYFYDWMIKLLGYTPFHWHVFVFAARFLSACLVWLIVRRVWKSQTVQACWVALLFLIYPVFFQQQVSVAFSQHWASYLLFFASIYLMVLAVQIPRARIVLTFFSMLMAGLQLLNVEYFVGIELLRLPLLYILFADRELNAKQRIGMTLKAWVPYALVLIGFVLWRLFFIQLPIEDRNHPEVLFGLVEHPRYYSARLVQMVLQDTLNMFVTAWYKTINPALFAIEKGPSLWVNISIWAGVALVGVVTAFFLFSQNRTDPGTHSRWYQSAVPVGLLGVLLGHAPSWAIGRQAFEGGLWSDRFALPAMFGASLLMVAVIDAVMKNNRQKIILISLMTALAVGANLRNVQDYIRSWQMQTDFYWQLTWRAPGIETPVAIFSDNELFPKMGEYPSSMAFSLLYPQDENEKYVSFWLFSLNKHFANRLDHLFKGGELYAKTASFEFDVSSRNSLVVDYDPDSHCLWLLSPSDQDNPLVAEISRKASAISDIARISPASSPGFPPVEIIGREPPRSWCYYYQKAELASQFADWATVEDIYNEALSNGLTASNPMELTPFIQAYLYQSKWDEAYHLSMVSVEQNAEIAPWICGIWENSFDQPGGPSADLQDEICNQLHCQGQISSEE